MSKTKQIDFETALQAYVDFINGNYEAWSAKSGTTSVEHRTMSDKRRSKFVRIFSQTSNQRLCHSFVVYKDFTNGAGKKFRQGDILMSASWAGPALNHARGNIMDLNYGNATWTGAGYITK